MFTGGGQGPKPPGPKETGWSPQGSRGLAEVVPWTWPALLRPGWGTRRGIPGVGSWNGYRMFKKQTHSSGAEVVRIPMAESKHRPF